MSKYDFIVSVCLWELDGYGDVLLNDSVMDEWMLDKDGDYYSSWPSCIQPAAVCVFSGG